MTMKLICLPYAGGTAASFDSWLNLSDSFEVFPVEYPGRGALHALPLAETMDELTDSLVAAIAPLIDGSYVLYGHSLGGSVAVALVGKLLTRGLRPPLFVGVGAARGPGPVGRDRVLHTGLTDAELVEELIRIGGIPKLLQGYPEVIARYVGGLRKDLLLLEGWVASGLRPIPVPIAVFAGVRDQLVAVDRCRRWERMTTSSFWFETIEGDHFFLQTHASDVVGHLRQIADAVRIQDQSSADGHNL